MRALTYNEKKYWQVGLADEIEFAIVNDGLVVMFDREDVEEKLRKYEFDPTGEGHGAWWWNSSHDRHIAEVGIGGRIMTNPAFLRHNFETIVYP